LRIWNECIMLVLDYLMGRRIRHYWLTMNLPKCFGIQNGVVFFFWIIKGTNASQLWPLLFELPLVKTIQIHYDCMVKYFKHCLSLSLKIYYWFI
jgi:hypothetical protein